MAASWEAWQEAEGTLAGVAVGPLTCWATGYPYVVHEAEATSRLVTERVELLAGFRRWLLHDDEPKHGYFSRSTPFHKRSFLQEATTWRNQALHFAQEVFALREALEHVAKRYFEGRRLLFDEELKALEAQAKIWHLLLEQFNAVVVVEFERVGEDGPRVARLELVTIEEEARAEALRMLDETNAAADLMAKYI